MAFLSLDFWLTGESHIYIFSIFTKVFLINLESTIIHSTLRLCMESKSNKWQGPALVARSRGSKNVTYKQHTT